MAEMVCGIFGLPANENQVSDEYLNQALESGNELSTLESQQELGEKLKRRRYNG